MYDFIIIRDLSGSPLETRLIGDRYASLNTGLSDEAFWSPIGFRKKIYFRTLFADLHEGVVLKQLNYPILMLPIIILSTYSERSLKRSLSEL